MTSMTDELTRAIGDFFNRKYVFLTGRATTALYLGFRSIRKEGEIIFQDMLCPSPVVAALQSGFSPRFCDISPVDYNISPESLIDTISPGTVGIMPAHIFGHAAPMEQLAEISGDHNLALIEDLAQSFPLPGDNFSHSDISVLSFGGKIINGGGGGAILTDNKDYAGRIESDIRKIPKKPIALTPRFDQYKEFYNSTIKIADDDTRKQQFSLLPQLFSDIYLYRYDEDLTERVYSEIRSIEKIRKIRNTNAELYAKYLHSENVVKPSYSKKSVLYRYSIIVKNNCEEITGLLRNHGYHASNLYSMPLHTLFASRQVARFPHADYISRHILNLWIEPGITEEYIKGSCELINSYGCD